MADQPVETIADPALPLPVSLVDRRGFLGAVAALLLGGRWLRPERPVHTRFAIRSNGDLAHHAPPLHPQCRCVTVTTWNYDQPHLEPGDVIRFTGPDERETLFTLLGVRDGRHLTLREMRPMQPEQRPQRPLSVAHQGCTSTADRVGSTSPDRAVAARHLGVSAAHRGVGLT